MLKGMPPTKTLRGTKGSAGAASLISAAAADTSGAACPFWAADGTAAVLEGALAG